MVGQLAAPVTAPKLNSITYNRFSITARWSGDASAGNCYLLALYENGIQYKTQQVVGSSGALLNLTLDSQKTYTVMVAQTDFSYGSVGPYSNEITVIQAIPTDIQVTYNGSDIHARWDWPDESLSIEGGLISLFKADGSQLLVSEKLIGNQGTLIPSPPLLDITDYFVTVAYSTPGSTGPGSDPIPIIQQTVCLYRLTYNGDSIVATTDRSLSNPNEIGLFLYVDGQPAYSATGAGNLVILSLYKPLQPWQHAHVQVAVIQDHTCGPLSQPIPVLTGSLCLQSVSYDGNAISASWSGSTPNFEYTGATMLLFQEDTLVTNNSVIGMQGTLTLAAALDPAKQYSLRVAPNLGPSRGINSDAIPVVSSSGTFTQTSYQDGVVNASWTTAGTAGLTGCMFALLDGNELIASVPAGMSGGALDHNLPPGTNYRVAVRQMAGISLGPPSYAPVLTTAALIDEVITENDKITVLIAGTAGAQAFLYKGDTLQAGPVVASGTPLKAEIPFGVVPYYDYKIRVQAVQGSTFGPISAPTHVISGVPNILTSTYNGDDVKLSWEPVLNEPVTGYEVYLLDLDHGTSNTAYTKDDFIIVQVPPEGRHALQVKAIGAAASGILSPAVNVIKEKMRISSLAYDGTHLHTSWTASTITEAVYQISIIDDNDFTMLFDVTGHEAVLPMSLNPSINYTVKVRVVADNDTGSWGPGTPVISALPLITSTVAENSKVSVFIDDTPVKTKPGVTGCQAFLYQDNTLVSGPIAAAGTPLKADFPISPLAYRTYAVRIQAVGAGGTGPPTESTPVISGIPFIRSLDYNGVSAIVAWNPVSGENVTGYKVHLLDTEHGITAHYSTEYCSIEIPVSIMQKHTLQIQAVGNSCSGPLSMQVNVINEIITVLTVSYDGTFLHAAWTASMTPGADYQVCVSDDNGSFMLFDVTGNQESLPVSLNPTCNYVVNVRVVSNGVTGPWGTGMPVLSALPLISSTVADNTKVSVFIDDAPVKTKPGVTGCQAFLYQDNTLVSGPIAAAGTPLKADFPISPLAYQTYTVRIQAVGASGTGPLTESAPVISGIPFIRSLDYDGVSAILAWDSVSGENVTGYKVHLLGTEHSITTYYFTKYCFIEIPVSIMQKHVIQIQAIGNSCSGPLSAQVSVINETITVSTVSYDGTFLQAAWTASATPGAAYQVCVSDDNDFSVLFDVTGNQESLPVNLNPTYGYVVNVRVVSNGVTGPWGPATPVISALPLVTSTTADHTKVTLLIDDASVISKPGVTGCQAYLTRGDGVVWGPVMAAGTPLKAEFPVNVLPYHTYTAMVQAVGPAGTGPLTNGVPVLSAVPVIKALDYDGTMVYAAWSPVSAPVTGYTLTLASDSGSAVTVSSELPYVSVPLDVQTASGTYTVSVQAIHGIASGPKSDGKNPIKPGLFYSTETANAPALKPANSTLPVQPFETCCLLPELYQTPPAVLPSVGSFVLKFLTGAGNMKYYLAFAPSNPVWEFDANPFRSSIATDYVNFLTALEGKLKEQDPQTIGVLLPGAVQDVMQAIAGCIPQTFMESLYYSHGFSATWRYVDLRPGMRLQVEYESWQYISAQAPTYSNGYSFNGTIQYDISRFMTASGEHSTVLNVFLSSLEGLAIPAPTGSGPGPIDGGGGGIDTLFTGFAQPFLRIFYPTSLKKPCEVGSTYPRDNVMILAAASWSTLNNITDKITQGLAIPAFGTDYALFYLRGRNTLTPLIKVSVNGYPTWLPVGTTLAQALSQHGVSPFAIPVVISGLELSRNWSGTCGNDSAGLTTFVPRYKIPIRINWGPSVLYANGAGWLDLPLIHGDEIQIMGDHL